MCGPVDTEGYSFKGLASVIVSDGPSCFSGKILGMIDFSVTNFQSCSPLSRTNISLCRLPLILKMSDQFHLPLSVEAFSQYQQLETIVADTILHDGNDT